MKTLALRARVFIHCFLVFGYPGETLALVVHILHTKLNHIIFMCTGEMNVMQHFKNFSLFVHINFFLKHFNYL